MFRIDRIDLPLGHWRKRAARYNLLVSKKEEGNLSAGICQKPLYIRVRIAQQTKIAGHRYIVFVLIDTLIPKLDKLICRMTKSVVITAKINLICMICLLKDVNETRDRRRET